MLDSTQRSIAWMVWLIIAGFCAAGCAGPPAAKTDLLLARLRAVGPEGAGNAEAVEASREIARLGPEALPRILEEMDGAGPVPLNWLRGAADAVAERAMAAGRPLPAAELEQLVLDRDRAGRARRLAFEWLAKVDPTAPDRLIPGMLDDPSVELRRDAVTRKIEAAQRLLDAGKKDEALAAFRQLFPASRDPDQVDLIAKRLESLGDRVDLTRHYGCMRAWHVIGPFDNAGKAGFHATYPPEVAVDLEREHAGKAAPVHWSAHATDDPFGKVDLNKAIGKHMGAVAYAFTRVPSAAERPIHIRVGSPNAVKIWLNGLLVFTRDEYHHGFEMDQYVAPGRLRPGENTILLKVCQNEQTEDWAQHWTFQLRVCDPTGGGVL